MLLYLQQLKRLRMSDSQAADSADVSSYSLAEVAVTDFSYVAEGGANLVVAYTGEDDSSFLQGSVLRIRKKIHDAPSLSETTLKEEDASVAFTDGVVVPLLPEHATPRLLSIPVHDKEWLQQLAEHIQYSRPLARRDVDDIDIDRGYVVLADNLVGTASDDSMSIAVEIKPKWGFLPNATHLSSTSLPIKTSHCRFCLHRLHKLHSHSHHHASSSAHTNAEEYCPLDLYSQDKVRVSKALRALVKSWEDTNGKGNNLKLFFEGQMVIPSENTGFLGDKADTEGSIPSLLRDFIVTSPLVRRLAQLQRTLDPLDIEGLNALIQAQTGIDLLQASEEEISQALGGEITLEEYTTFVKSYLSHESSSSSAHTGTQSISTSTFLNEETPLRTLVIAYLLSASFKDCSMFITIKQQPDTHSGKEMNAYLVDVDLKSIKRLGRYAKLDRDLVQSFVKFEAEGGRLEQCIV